MFNPDTGTASAFMPSLETAARSLKVEQIIAHIHSDAEIETAISHSARREAGRSPGAVFDKIRDGSEPQGREGALAHGATIDSAARRRGD